jgi:NitT/TauT family transport system substrate-binding protein
MIARRELLGIVMAVLLGALAADRAAAAELGTVRVGVLQFGTVNWELDVIKTHGLDAAHGFALEVQPFGSGDATNVALQGGAVDAIVDDYLWVSRQRAQGEMLTFVPYSSTIGALMVPADSGIASLADLAGKKLGIAGGPVDKSWLLIRGLAQQEDKLDLATALEPVYGAPPLLNEKIADGELDAVLTYWHFAARLEAKGYKRLLDVNDAIARLGVASTVPQLGYVFQDSFAQAHPELIAAFVEASRAAKKRMRTDEEWDRLRPLTKAEDDATLAALKAGYQAGIIEHWGPAEQADATKLYQILAGLGGAELVGDATGLTPGTFWQGAAF